jgi:hypothetical protein
VVELTVCCQPSEGSRDAFIRASVSSATLDPDPGDNETEDWLRIVGPPAP